MLYGVIRRCRLTDADSDGDWLTPTFNKLIHRHRNVVERGFNRLEQCRSVATRYDRNSTGAQPHPATGATGWNHARAWARACFVVLAAIG
ncbi:hypothetical protein GCM10020358_02920 [Amorphoplanes nipponensis]|uniref:Transposase DDE domain-containing protein n=1 Tax=Actinoplanes nipponensis TaxID=135950 RepID=A0A919MQU8_9ACTN|nr:transposase [Actinoplanes nipponensis]GIE54021.1 hypothetical protein Ani05nite_75550 [Actinoplanes nipponensis]